MTDRLIDQRASFDRDDGRGAVHIEIVNEPRGVQYLAIRRVGDRCAAINFHMHELRRLWESLKRCDEVCNGVSKERVVDPVLRGAK